MAGSLVSVYVVEAPQQVSFRELCRVCRITPRVVADLIDEGIIDPTEPVTRPIRWRFPAHALWRARTALQLQDDLGVNLAGAALAVDLLEQMNDLRTRMSGLERQLFGSSGG